MIRQISPCTNCKNRFEACHDSCDTYKDWKEQQEAIRQKMFHDKEYDYYQINNRFRSSKRTVKPKHPKIKRY